MQRRDMFCLLDATESVQVTQQRERRHVFDDNERRDYHAYGESSSYLDNSIEGRLFIGNFLK